MKGSALPILEKIYASNGAGLLQDPRRIRSLLLDLAAEHKREINLLVIAAQDGIPGQLLNAGGAPVTMLIPRLAGELSEHWGLSPQAALWAVSGWAQVIGLLQNHYSLPPTRLNPNGNTTVQPASPPRNKDIWPLMIGGSALELVKIPKGIFKMGAPKQDELAWPDEQPIHLVHMAECWIGRTPVTVAQFSAFVDDTGFRTTAEKQGAGRVWNGSGWEQVTGATWWQPTGPGSQVAHKFDHPVTMVAWPDARAYCEWAAELSAQPLRLPSEAEWEKAAKGPKANPDLRWPWGTGFPDPTHCNFNGDVGDTTPVGKYPEGNSALGCADVAGNVWEWTESLFRPYPYRSGDGRESASETGPRVLRGGSYGDSYRDVRCTVRLAGDPKAPSARAGFRVCVRPMAGPG
jgi:formylglycine-generating enzyme required for sulfatase activity